MNIFNKLNTALNRTFSRMFSMRPPANTASGNHLIIEPLTDRELVRVHGEDVVPFLQGLITNDMKQLQKGHGNNTGSASMFAMFLNKAGRVLYDCIIYKTPEPDTYLIECDRRASPELRRHLRLYRVRRKIEIDSLDKEYKAWIAFNPNFESSTIFNTSDLPPEIFTTPDPRIQNLGLRVITSSEKTRNDLCKAFNNSGETIAITPSDSCNYRLHRYRHGVGEGVVDLPPGKCFPLEANGDFLNGVNFNKGCYIGQELTARVYHNGVIRKRLMPLRLTETNPRTMSVISQAGANVGNVRGVTMDRALALMRVEPVLHGSKLSIDDSPCFAEKPKWWPSEMPNMANHNKRS